MTFLTKLCTKIEFCICTSSLLFCLGIMIHNTFVVSVAYFLHLLGFTMMQNYYHTLFYCLIYVYYESGNNLFFSLLATS